MWGNQGYDQPGGYDQGGGYLNSPGVSGSQQASQSTGQKNRTRAQNIMPCTVAQIFKAEQVDDKFMIDGIELHQITVLGLVRSAKESSTRLEYEIDDMSGGLLDVRQFVDNDENTPELERTALLRENTYVRAHGHLRAFAGKRSMVAFRMMPVLDINELTSHLLEVIHVHVTLTRTDNDAMDTGNRPGMSRPAAAMQGSSTGHTVGPTTSYNAGPNAGYTGGAPDLGLNPQQAQVLNVIRSCIDEQGLSISTVSERLRGMPQKVIKDAVEFLSSEGHIYSTIDDEHYKATDSL